MEVLAPEANPRSGGRQDQGAMAVVSESEIWKQIDEAERLLICGMFEKAPSLASSVAQHIFAAELEESVDDIQLNEMIEVAGMILIQSLNKLGRTSRLFVELKKIYGGTLEAIPVQVFLIGASLQMTEGFVSNLRVILEEYLAKWKYVDGDVYILTEPGQQNSSRCMKQNVMSCEDYLDLAELYTVRLLGMTLHIPDVAITWTERAELLEEDREDLLRRLRSVQSAMESSSAVQGTKQITEDAPSRNVGSPKTNKLLYVPNGEKIKESINSQQSVQRANDWLEPFFRWFRSISIKFGKFHLIIPSGKLMFLFSLVFATLYILRNQSNILKRIAAGQALSLKRALIDAWQLAFSVQMNPLAAVQQLPSAPRGNW